MPQPEKEPTEFWEERERRRFEQGVYQELPLSIRRFLNDNPITKHHHAHVDIEGKGLVAYTEDERRGKADTQKVIKVRRYLHNFFYTWLQSHFGYSDVEIAPMIEEMAIDLFRMVNKPQVLLAMNPDHIRWVLSHSRNIHDIRVREDDTEYVITGSDVPEKHRGCPSCMTYQPEGSRLHSNNGYKCKPIMPCEIYGYGDLGIAHLIAPENPNLVKARVLVWPDKKIISGNGSSGYFKGRDGWEEQLKLGLSDKGYTVGNILGAKMYRWEHDGKIIAPYLDGDDGLEDCGSYLKIVRNSDGSMIADQIDGMANVRIEEDNDDTEYCFNCDDYYDPEDMSSIYHNDGRLCDGCSESYFSCYNCEEATHNDDWVEVDCESWCLYCSENDAFNCEHCSTLRSIHDSDMREDKDGDCICDSCVEESDEYTFMTDGCLGIIINYSVTVAQSVDDSSVEEELTREEA